MNIAAWNDAIIVAPQGAPRTFEQFGDRARPGWQIDEGDLGGRDLAMFDALVGELERRGCLDRRRVYSTGFSNGGFFSNVLACHRGDVIAAAAPVGGGGPFSPCTAKVPIMITHGRADEVVAHEMAEQTFGRWIGQNGCDAGARPPASGCADAPGCPADAQVRMCSHDMGHVWPDGQSERVTEFLRRFARP
jgi:polyhydroxybutyrate depolymerase